MSNRVSIEVLGLKELRAKLTALPVEVNKQKVLLRALHDGARLITAEAKRLAPVLKEQTTVVTPAKGRRKAREGTRYRIKGALRAGIVQHTSPDHHDTVVVRVRNRGYIFEAARNWGRRMNSSLSGNPNYWWLVEFGTSKAPAQPFMRPAFEGKKVVAAMEIRNSLAQGIRVIWNQLVMKNVFRKAA